MVTGTRTALLSVLLAVALLPGQVAARGADRETLERLQAWRADLDYLYEQIEKPSDLRAIFKVKGIDWPAVKREAEQRFLLLGRTAARRRGPDRQADEVAFYDLLLYIIGQLRDSHAFVKVPDPVAEAWRAAQPPSFEAGIELQPGPDDMILVSNTFAARSSSSPLRGRGVDHDGTLLVSVDGVPAERYFAERAREMFTVGGWQSTPGRAYSSALNDLHLPEGGKMELVFRALDSSEATRRSYLELPPAQRRRAFAKLKWKTKKVTLHASECANVRNPHNFAFMHLPRPELQETVAKGVAYRRLDSGMGYILYFEVAGDSRQGLDQACKALENCPGVILDMRFNGGGGESGIDAFDRRTGTWKKPLAVIMGPRTFSAAETEIWSLMQMRDNHQCTARFLGRTTAGASGDKVNFELPSGFATGRFVYKHWHGGRSQIEGTGLEPDEEVLQDPVELSLGIDSCIRAAEQWLATAGR